MRPFPTASLALVFLLHAAAAQAGPRLHGIPAHVRAGSDLRITWAGLGRDVHEAELELSLEGGRWVRISPELEARDGRFDWHVPDGLAGLARLRLRYGGEGFESEAEGAIAFVIDATAGHASPRLPDASPGDWWRLAHGSGHAPLDEIARTAWLQAADSVVAIHVSPRATTRPDAPTRWTRAHVLALATADDPRTRGDRARHYPLRN
jgi:hypothetical protein